MARWLLVLGVLLVALLAALWWVGARRVGRLDAPRVAGEPSAPSGSAPAVLVHGSPGDGGPSARELVGEAAAARPGPADGASAPQPSANAPIATLSVRTVDKASGAAVPRVHLTIAPRAPERLGAPSQRRSGWTGDDGHGVFELSPGVPYRLSASGDRDDVGGGEADLGPLAPAEFREIVVAVPTGTDLHFFGQVRARDDGAPVAEASIELLEVLHWRRPPEERVLSTTAADADGTFELRLSSWKARDLRIRAPGFCAARVRATAAHETRDEARVFHLYRPASLRARVLEASGAPLAEVSVRLTGEPYPIDESDYGEDHLFGLPDQEWLALADPSGLCTFGELPPEIPLRVEILQHDEVVKDDLPTLSLRPREVRAVTWTLGTGCRIEGIVVEEDGSPVPGQRLWLERASADRPVFFQSFQSVPFETMTGENGRFAFADVGPGRWWLGPAATRGDRDAFDPQGIAPVGELVQVGEGETKKELRLVILRGLCIRGRVLDPAGEPAPGIHVVAWPDIAWYVSTDAGPDGAFVLGPLVPGRYSLRARGASDADSPRVVAYAGDEDVVLCLGRGATLSGTVVDGATRRPFAARITVARTDLPQGVVRTAEAGDDGAFSIEGLAEGTYDLAAQAGGPRVGLLRALSVAAGTTADRVVTLVPGASLRVKYAAREGYLFCRVHCDGALVAEEGVQAGGTSTIVVPSGPLVLECSFEGTTETRELDLAAGKEAELRFGDDE